MERLTIDEAIAHAREVAKKNRAEYEFECSYYGKETVDNGEKLNCVKCAEEYEQLAEWLEELKELRKIKEDYAKGMQTSYATFMYNKAIDDFVRFANTMPTVEEEDGEIRPMWLEEMAEKLKAGE